MNIESFNINERVQKAVTYFESGYNCSQSVFLAYADLVGMDEETAGCVSVSLGGGMGRMREVCGAVSGMFMLTGFKYKVTPGSHEEKKRNYARVQQLAAGFKELNGSIICRDLLSLKKDQLNDPEPSLRTYEYYSTRPCARIIADCAYLAGEMLQEKIR